ncbi:MAG: hypothetical protein AAF363_12510 [Bacteroidota bacterium]
MEKSSKVVKLNRVEVLKIFTELFNLIGIKADVSREFTTNQPFMKQLAEKILSEKDITSPYTEQGKTKTFKESVDDYSEYLRKRLNMARKESNELISFQEKFIAPLQKFPLLFSTTLLQSVVYTSKKFSWFNFCRMPVYGELNKRNGKFYFDSKSKDLEIELVRDKKNSLIKMPRDQTENWLKTISKDKRVYLAEFDITDHQIIPPNNLVKYLILDPSLQSG